MQTNRTNFGAVATTPLSIAADQEYSGDKWGRNRISARG